MLRNLALLGLAARASAQIDTAADAACPRRLNFDLSNLNTEIDVEWTSATAPTGTVYKFNDGTIGTCTFDLTAGASPSGRACPPDGIPYGMNATSQTDQAEGVTYTDGFAPFMASASGKIRIMNAAKDNENLDGSGMPRPVDILLSLVPDAQMQSYTSLVEMKFNSIIMPWNNDVPSTQFRLTSGGLIALGFGLLPATCTSTGNLVSNVISTFCPVADDAVGYGAEYKIEFVYGDTFSFAGVPEPLSPPLDSYYVVFWDVDGDRVDNSLLNAFNFTNIQEGPELVGGNFPSTLVFEELYEVNSVYDAASLVFVGPSVTTDNLGTQTVVKGNTAGTNVGTDFTSNPYRDITVYASASNAAGIAIYQVKPQSTGFDILIGGVSSVGRQYRDSDIAQPMGLLGAQVSVGLQSPNAPWPKRQNDRGFLLSLIYPEKSCTCDMCPESCKDPITADANCARHPDCPCPTACQGGTSSTRPAVCGSSANCPAVDCPAECAFGTSAGVLSDYYSYCRRNPACGCPPKCSGCASGAAPGSATCAEDCVEFAGCSICSACGPGTPPGSDSTSCITGCLPRTCTSPSPPPFPPPYPPLPCYSWCNAGTCSMSECEGCSACESISAGSYCASWCNAYTCSESLCQGCTMCSGSPSSSSCKPWCSAYTCFGSCTSCSVCGLVATGNYCASWCNAYTCGGSFTGLCGGCSACAAVSSQSYCASWCNGYTCGGIFSGLCGGCSVCS